MRTEQYDWVDEHDRVVGRGSARDCHSRGKYTRSVHVLLVDPTGRLLICKRSPKKKSYPDQYTSSAGGHVELSESYRVAAQRELKEELGISVPLTDAGRFDVVNKTEAAIHRLFVGRIGRNIKVVTNWEVVSYKLARVDTLWIDVLKHPTRYAAPFREALVQYVAWKYGPTYVLDFDHTLFDWYRFKSSLESCLYRTLKIPPRIFRTAKNKLEQESSGNLYNINEHLREVARKSEIPLPAIQKEYARFLRTAPAYIYSDARKFLTMIKKRGARKILLTFGNKTNQKHFIDATKMNSSFRSTIYASKKMDKVTAMKKLTKQPRAIVLINDDPAETDMIYKKVPMMRIVLVERKGAKYYPIAKKHHYTVVQNLTKVRL